MTTHRTIKRQRRQIARQWVCRVAYPATVHGAFARNVVLALDYAAEERSRVAYFGKVAREMADDPWVEQNEVEAVVRLVVKYKTEHRAYLTEARDALERRFLWSICNP